jgi:hypothetical protein
MRAILGVFSKIPRPTPAMGVALLALIIAACGAAVATIPSNGTITACYNNNSGALRVMDTEDSQPQPCSSRETQLAWKDGSTLLGKDEKAADSERLDGLDSTAFLGATQKAADSDKLDGMDSAKFAGPGETAYRVGTDLTPCTEKVLLGESFSPSRPAVVYAIGTAVYSPGTTNLDAGSLGLELRDGDDTTTLAGGGVTVADGNGADVPLSVQGILRSGNNSQAVYSAGATPFEVTPGNVYTLRLLGNSSNGSCLGSDQGMRSISLTYVLIGKED